MQRYIVLFFIELSTRRVEVAGIASWAKWSMDEPHRTEHQRYGRWTVSGKRYLIHDRDPLFTAEFLNMLAASEVKSVKLPPRSPNLNAHAERFVRSLKESCLERLIPFGESSLRQAIQNFVAHYHSERNHQGLTNQLIQP